MPTSGSLNADPEDNLYSIPASSEADKAFTEYTLVKEVQVVPPPAASSTSGQNARLPVDPTSMANVKNNKISDSELEIYSAASTLSLGETVILSDGWLNLNLNNTAANSRENTNSLSSNSLTDYTAVHSAPNISHQHQQRPSVSGFSSSGSAGGPSVSGFSNSGSAVGGGAMMSIGNNSEISSDQDLNSSQSTIVLTLDVDTSASVI